MSLFSDTKLGGTHGGIASFSGCEAVSSGAEALTRRRRGLTDYWTLRQPAPTNKRGDAPGPTVRVLTDMWDKKCRGSISQ
jgi:hypothetical protein